MWRGAAETLCHPRSARHSGHHPTRPSSTATPARLRSAANTTHCPARPKTAATLTCLRPAANPTPRPDRKSRLLPSLSLSRPASHLQLQRLQIPLSPTTLSRPTGRPESARHSLPTHPPFFRPAFQSPQKALFTIQQNIFHWKFVLLENNYHLCIVIDRKPTKKRP